MPYRLLWVTTSVSWDGPGRALAALLRNWPGDDAIAVVALRDIADPFRAALGTRVTTHALGMRSLFDVRAVMALQRFARQWQPSVVHTQLSRADWIGRVIAGRLAVPAVSTIQNVHSRMYPAEFNRLTSTIALRLDRLTGRQVDRLIAVSNGVRADLLQLGFRPEQVVVIPNAFDPSRPVQVETRSAIRRRLGIADDEVLCGTVALLKTQKGIRDLVDAVALAAAANRSIRFVHAGGGPLEADVRSWIRAAGAEDRFSLLGWVDDPLALLPGMDVFVLPSLWEGLPIALLEAMAAGLPAVGTRVAGIEEVIVPGETGCLVPAHHPRALADAILQLAASEPLRRRMGQAGRQRLREFEAGPIAAATRQIHVEVLQSRSGRTG